MMAGRLITYRTGISSMGMHETMDAELCWRCDREADYDGYCADHYVDHVLETLRSAMDYVHENSNIYYDRVSMEAYKLLALAASNLRRTNAIG